MVSPRQMSLRPTFLAFGFKATLNRTPRLTTLKKAIHRSGGREVCWEVGRSGDWCVWFFLRLFLCVDFFPFFSKLIIPCVFMDFLLLFFLFKFNLHHCLVLLLVVPIVMLVIKNIANDKTYYQNPIISKLAHLIMWFLPGCLVWLKPHICFFLWKRHSLRQYSHLNILLFTKKN